MGGRGRGRHRPGLGRTASPLWGIRGSGESPRVAGPRVATVASRSSASRREETPSFRSRLFTWERTVCSEMNSLVAISSVLEMVVEEEQYLDFAGRELGRRLRPARRRGGLPHERGRAAASRPTRTGLPRRLRRLGETMRFSQEARSSAGSPAAPARIASSRFSSVPDAVSTTTSLSGDDFPNIW